MSFFFFIPLFLYYFYYEKTSEMKLFATFINSISSKYFDKVGDGMNSFMAFKVNTKTNLSFFKKKESVVTRRFSDFLGRFIRSFLYIIYIVCQMQFILHLLKTKIGKKIFTFYFFIFLFVGLRDKLTEKYLQNGRIIPPAPDKSVLGMTKVKMSKEDDVSDQSG